MVLPVGVTMGDPAGIGPEIIVKLFDDGPPVPAIVIGDEGILRRTVGFLGTSVEVRRIDHPKQAHFMPKVINCLGHPALPEDLPFGRADPRAGRAAYDYIITAIELALGGDISAMVTAPINKEAFKMAGIAYPGHTELLAEKFGVLEFAMMVANDELRVILATVHIPLSKVTEALTVESELRAIRLAHRICLKYGLSNPKVAVAGLNPHAGENGLFGAEEVTVIIPAIAQAREEGIDASGPWAGDTVFMRARNGDFDVVVAQYHDQGLIPVKYFGIDHGVNVTLGLPFVRTSVDHGTAFDIAGSGKADHRSLRYALDQAAILAGLSESGSFDAVVRSEETKPVPADRAAPAFIFMLTRNDRTIADAHTRVEEAVAAGVRHIGFKDIGLPLTELTNLASQIRRADSIVYLEVVSLDEASEVASARAALELGVDVVMGGIHSESVAPILKGSGIRYFPFAGDVRGHPSRLLGEIDDIITSCKRIAAMPDVDGIDLLAYRYDGDADRLIREVNTAVSKPVIIAGSIDRRDRIDTVVRAGSYGFTVGTAALDEAFPAASPGLSGQLHAITKISKEARMTTG